MIVRKPMDERTFITQEGLRHLTEELEKLKTTSRKEIASRIQAAKELGDLSENAEYQEAKEEQGFVEGKIAELEFVIKNAQVIRKHHSGTVEVGSTIHVKSPKGVTQIFTITGSQEADPVGGKISNESPMGKAFLGHKAGEMVEVKSPRGILEFKIVSID